MAENETVKTSSDTIIAIIFIAVFLGVMILALVLTINSVSVAESNLNGNSSASIGAVNESHYMNGTIGYVTLSNSLYNGYSTGCSGQVIYNTSGTLIAHGNWSTQSGCRVTILTNTHNNTIWLISYTATYDNTNATVVNTGLTSIKTDSLSMIGNFFALMPTVGTIFAVIILIAGIVSLVLYVRRMKDSGSGTGDQAFTG